jgi:hypothetical protein
MNDNRQANNSSNRSTSPPRYSHADFNRIVFSNTTASARAVQLLSLLFTTEELEKENQNALDNCNEGGREVEALDRGRVNTILDNLLNTVTDKEAERRAMVNAINKKLNYYRRMRRFKDGDWELVFFFLFDLV